MLEKSDKKKNNILRVVLKDLPARENRATDDDLAYILKRVTGQQGAVCKRDCDCAFGLVCADGRCESDW